MTDEDGAMGDTRAELGTKECPVQFDAHSREYASDPVVIGRNLQQQAPVAWSEKHGGFWILTGYPDASTVTSQHGAFSSRHDLPNGSSPFQGEEVPPLGIRMIPVELDPPEFNLYRRLLNPLFAPVVVQRLESSVRQFADWALDQGIESGGIDFVDGFATKIPTLATLLLLGLPLDEWETWGPPMHDNLAGISEDPAVEHADDAMLQVADRLLTVANDRKRNPESRAGHGAIDYLIDARIDGEPIPDGTLSELLFLLMAGGVHTTAGSIGAALDLLDQDRDARERLRSDPSLLPTACEEVLRLSAPSPFVGRTASEDAVVGSRQIAEGERVQICLAAANRDPTIFDQPDDFLFDRTPNRHLSFGSGIHRCIGAAMARMELRVALEEILSRIPDYSLVRDGIQRYSSMGIQNGYVKMPAVFSSGIPLGANIDVRADQVPFRWPNPVDEVKT